MIQYRFALAGNQNCGKTTLFNRLTGANQHVGNWPGVTVEQKTGWVSYGATDIWENERAAKGETGSIQIVDLPGMYSLSPYSMEEAISRDYLIHEKPDLILNVVDATNLERSLYLTLQLAQLGLPMVIALNMMDEVRAAGVKINVGRLEARLGIPVVPVCARKREGMNDLLRRCIDAARKHLTPSQKNPFEGSVGRWLKSVEELVEFKARRKGIYPRYAAAKILEGDKKLLAMLALDGAQLGSIETIIRDLEKERGMEQAAVMADARYKRIEEVLSACVSRKSSQSLMSLSVRIDNVLTHPALAIPLFLAVMLLVFWITFGPVGSFFSDAFDGLIQEGIRSLRHWLGSYKIADWLQALLVDGIFTGVGSVLSFLPTIIILFTCLSVLEDSGYMARAAFLMDKPLKRIGLNGRAFIPMMLGFGCTVPAAMAARSMNSRRDKRFTILLTPFMSCGAKVPVYALFADAFFDGCELAVMVFLYALGIGVAFGAGFLLKSCVFHGDAEAFMMELPSYRLPTAPNVFKQTTDKAKDFLQRAFTVIFLATIAVWVLENYTLSFQPARQIRESMLGLLAGSIAPFFAPIGFGSIEAAAALLTGLLAKESVASTLAVLAGAQLETEAMAAALRSLFPSMAAVCSFLTFTLLYMPCTAACAAMAREMESKGWAAAAAMGQTGVAWLIAGIVYLLAGLIL